MMNDKLYLKIEISEALRIISFIAAICVVMIHANVDGKWNFMCGTLTGWAVPFFFACSGFFFGIGDFVREGGYVSFLQKKFYGLFVPYVIWIFIALVICMPLVMVNNCLQGEPLFSRTVLAESGLFNVLDATFAILRSSPKPIGVLWFVRALLILFILAPVWRMLARMSLAWVFVVMYAYFGFKCPLINFHGFELRIGIASYFFIGLAIAVYTPRSWLFKGADKHVEFVPGPLMELCSLSFWVYVTHNLFLQYIIAIGHFAFHKSPLSLELLCPVSIVVAVACSVGSGLCPVL